MANKPAHAHSTSRDTDVGRVRVEHGETSQATGTQFQAQSVATASLNPQVMRIVAPEPIDITEIEMTVNLGGVSVSIFEAGDGAAGGTFTPVTLTSTNRRIQNTPSFTVETGGTFNPVGNPVRPPLSVSTGASGSNVLSNVSRQERRLSLLAGTYYVVIGLLVGVTSFTGNLVLTISEVLDS